MYTLSFSPILDTISRQYVYVWCLQVDTPPSNLKEFFQRRHSPPLSEYKGSSSVSSSFTSSYGNHSCVWIFRDPKRNQMLSRYEDIAFIYSVLEQKNYQISFPLSNLLLSDPNRNQRITNIFFYSP